MADRKKKPGHDDAWWAAQRHAYIEKNDILLSDYPSWEWVSPYDFWRTIFPDGFLQPRGEVVPWHERGGGHPNGIVIQITHKTKTVKTKTGIEHDVPVIERFTLPLTRSGVPPETPQPYSFAASLMRCEPSAQAPNEGACPLKLPRST